MTPMPTTRPAPARRRLTRFTALGAALVLASTTALAASIPGHSPLAAAQVASSEAQLFVTMSPLRVLDTRPATGPIGVPVAAKLGQGAQLDLILAGAGRPLPTGASAAAINITIDDDATLKSFLTVWPKGEGRPNASANNAEPGLVAANSMIAKLGTDGGISIFNQRGAAHVVIDVVGYLMPASLVTGLGTVGPAGPAGPGVQTGTTTPVQGAACTPNGLLNINTVTGHVSVCVTGQWNAPVNVRSTIDGATSYDDSGTAAVDIDLGTSFGTIASFTAAQAGTFLLDGTATIQQSALLLVAALADVRCAWFDAAGSTRLGPLSGESAVAQASLLGTPNEVTLNARAEVTLAAGAQATLRCQFTGVSLALGGFEATSWSYTATRTS